VKGATELVKSQVLVSLLLLLWGPSVLNAILTKSTTHGGAMRILCTATLLLFSLNLYATPKVKDWTFLIFLNGHNNLDSYGPTNIKEMEKVGSTNKINILVEWATRTKETTDVLYVVKSNHPDRMVSKVVRSQSRVDMGNPDSLVDFALWAIQNYPAKHYFIDIWNHGGGWHYQDFDPSTKLPPSIVYDNISWDDYSGNSINTPQLGEAMAKIAKAIGHPVDLYGSDACLMAMPDIAYQMKDSVDTFVGSEETEPGLGWPYQDLLGEWSKLEDASAEDVAKILTKVYVKSYQGGSHGNGEVTFSTFNLKQFRNRNFVAAMRDFANTIYTLSTDDKAKVRDVISTTQVFAYSDYGDLLDFLTKLQFKGINSFELYRSIEALKEVTHNLIIANSATTTYENAHGASIWLPADKETFDSYWTNYQDLDFHQATGWGHALKSLY
jgi:hypothetical protein